MANIPIHGRAEPGTQKLSYSARGHGKHPYPWQDRTWNLERGYSKSDKTEPGARLLSKHPYHGRAEPGNWNLEL